MKNAFGVARNKPALNMVLDGAAQLDPDALYDAIQIISDQLPAEDMERLANLIGRAAHQKNRTENEDGE